MGEGLSVGGEEREAGEDAPGTRSFGLTEDNRNKNVKFDADAGVWECSEVRGARVNATGFGRRIRVIACAL